MNKQLKEYTKAKVGDRVVPIHEALDPKRKRADCFKTGFQTLDEAMGKNEPGGMKDGDLMVISGKSGHGKTLIALNLVKNFMDNGVPPILFSYEVIIDNVYDTLIDMGVEKEPLIYTPEKNVTGDVEWIKEKIREADKKYYVKVVVIDHLDFVTAKGIKNDDHRRNEITNIITELKNFAIEEQKVIILLAHIVKTRENRLANEDIADSRAINNIADYILFVGREIDENGMAVGNSGIAKLTKNRFTGKQVSFQFWVENGLITSTSEKDENI